MLKVPNCTTDRTTRASEGATSTNNSCSSRRINITQLVNLLAELVENISTNFTVIQKTPKDYIFKSQIKSLTVVRLPIYFLTEESYQQWRHLHHFNGYDHLSEFINKVGMPLVSALWRMQRGNNSYPHLSYQAAYSCILKEENSKIVISNVETHEKQVEKDMCSGKLPFGVGICKDDCFVAFNNKENGFLRERTDKFIQTNVFKRYFPSLFIKQKNSAVFIKKILIDVVTFSSFALATTIL